MALLAGLKNFKAHASGDIKGQSMITARKDWIDVIEFSFGATAPRDSAMGSATGRRQYRPFSFSYVVDASFPLMAAVLDTNDTIEKMEFNFWMPRTQGDVLHKGGKEILTVEYIFTTVHLASLEFRQLNMLNPELVKYDMAVTVTAVFEKIEINYKNNAHTSFMAQWSAPHA